MTHYSQTAPNMRQDLFDRLVIQYHDWGLKLRVVPDKIGPYAVGRSDGKSGIVAIRVVNPFDWLADYIIAWEYQRAARTLQLGDTVADLDDILAELDDIDRDLAEEPLVRELRRHRLHAHRVRRDAQALLGRWVIVDLETMQVAHRRVDDLHDIFVDIE